MGSNDGDAATTTGDSFDRMGTLGVEEEFFVVDGANRPASGAEALLHERGRPRALDGRLDAEACDCVVETKTVVCDGVAAVERRLGETRAALRDHAAARGYGLAAAGLHPAMRWREHDGTQRPRYRELRRKLQYPQRRNTTTGLHVHVGVDDADKAVWIANEIRWYLPVLLALAANSPFYDGMDTGLASARAHVFGALPRTGIPPAFDSFDDFRRFEHTLADADAIQDSGGLWYDVRPNVETGTVEVRAPDAQADLDRVLALVEYVQALVTDLGERYEDGEDGRDYRTALLAENRWRALRYGHDASFVQPGGGVVDLPTVVEMECDRLGVSRLRHLLRAESGAETQRRVMSEGGLDAVCAALTLGDDESADRPKPVPAGNQQSRGWTG